MLLMTVVSVALFSTTIPDSELSTTVFSVTITFRAGISTTVSGSG